MSRWPLLSMLLLVNTPHEDVRRRGRNTLILTYGLLVMLLCFIPPLLTLDAVGTSLASVAVCAFAFVVVIVLARRGVVSIAAALLIAVTLGVPLGAALASSRVGAVPFFFLLGLLLASLTLQPVAILIVLFSNIVGMILLWVLIGARPQQLLGVNEVIVYSMLVQGFVTLLSILGARQTANALRAANQARILAEQNTVVLQQTLAEQEGQAQALREALDIQQKLNATITELSLPIIPIREHLLVLPLIGKLDGRRLALIEHSLLEQIAARHTQVVLLDITGVGEIQAGVAESLLRLATAVQLLGARPILVGLRAEVAYTLATTGAFARAPFEVHATVQQALERL